MTIGLIAVVMVLVLALSGILYRYLPRRLKQSYFVGKWKELQAYCKKRETWPKAIEEADSLLRKALKQKRFKGKSMGEKMVSAQSIFTNNDALWNAHNLYKKMIADTAPILKESDIRDALVGFRQALRDIGALPKDETS
jgi:hypothetical protein